MYNQYIKRFSNCFLKYRDWLPALCLFLNLRYAWHFYCPLTIGLWLADCYEEPNLSLGMLISFMLKKRCIPLKCCFENTKKVSYSLQSAFLSLNTFFIRTGKISPEAGCSYLWSRLFLFCSWDNFVTGNFKVKTKIWISLYHKESPL